MHRNCWGLMSLVAVMSGCLPFGEDKDEKQVTAETVADRAETVVITGVTSTLGSLQALAELDALNEADGVFGKLAAMVQDSDEEGEQSDPFAIDVEAPVGIPGTDEPDVTGEGVWFDEQSEDAAAEVAELLKTRILVEENRVASDSESATFLLRGDVVCVELCDVDGSQDASGLCSPTPDPECVEAIDAVEVRIKAILVGEDGLDLQIFIGPDQHHPLDFELRSYGVALEVDLAEAKLAIEYVDELVEQEQDESWQDGDEDGLVLPETLAGRIRYSITVHGDEDVTMELSIVEPVLVEQQIETGEVSVSIAKAEPLVSVRVNGAEKQLNLLVDLNSVDVSVPLAELLDWEDDSTDASEPPAGNVGLHLGGYGFGVTLDESIEQGLLITGINLGDTTTTLDKDGEILMGIDLNAASGRSYDLRISPDPDHDSVRIEVDPELHVEVALALQAIADYLDPDLPQALLDGTFTVLLSGDQPPAIIPLPADDTGFEGGLKIAEGTLTLSVEGTNNAQVVVQTGRCLTVREDVPEGGHELLGHFVAVDCP